jgi:hypothetical protein
MKKLLTLVLAVVLAVSFSIVGYAQETKPAAGGDKATTSAPEKKAEKKKVKKAKKAKKMEAAPAAEPAPAK